MNDQYGLGNLFDHESESQNTPLDSEEIPEMHSAADHATMELKTAIAGQKSNAPSVSELSRAAQALAASSACTAPAAEIEEEALLLLIRQMKSNKAAVPVESPSVPQLEGVGDAVISQPAPDAGCESGDSAASQPSDVHWRFIEDVTEDNNAVTESDVSVLCSWIDSCIKALAALREVSSHQDGRRLGEQRSITLLSMYAKQVPECTCVRCRWHKDGDLPELMWVSWLANSTTHGLLGRRARQVVLDEHDKVIFSTANVSFAKTGITGGLGHPELICDNNHCSLLIPWVGAAMKKVKRTSPDRDEVRACFMRVRAIFEIMMTRLTVGCIEEDEDCLQPPVLRCLWYSAHRVRDMLCLRTL